MCAATTAAISATATTDGIAATDAISLHGFIYVSISIYKLAATAIVLKSENRININCTFLNLFLNGIVTNM